MYKDTKYIISNIQLTSAPVEWDMWLFTGVMLTGFTAAHYGYTDNPS